MNTDWFLIPFIINLALIAYVKVNYKGYIKQILLSSFNYKASVSVFKETKSNKPKSAYILFFIFTVSGIIFIFQLFRKFLPDLSLNQIFLIAGASVFALFVLTFFNKVLNYISANIFLLDRLSREYNYNISIFNQSFGIVIFPITFLISFTEAPNMFIYTGIILFSTMYLLRVIRLIKINFNKQVNLLYMFLYLCTLEIIPILYIVKFLMLI